MPAPPARSSIFPASSLSPSSAKTLFAAWYDYTVALLGASGTAADARTALGAPAISDLQGQTKTAYTTSGTAPNFTVTTSPTYPARVAGQRMRVKFHAAGVFGSNALNRDGTGSALIKRYDSTGTKVAALVTPGLLADIEYDGTHYVMLNSLPVDDQLPSLTATVNANALTVTLPEGTTLQFRSTTLPSGSVTTITTQFATSVVASSGCTFGAVDGQAARLVVLAFNDAGTIRLGITNAAGGRNFDETDVLSFSSAITGTTTALYANGTYSNCPYRVVGYIEVTEATAGVYVSAPTRVQPIGGRAGVGVLYNRLWQTVSRTSGVTYWNTTGRTIAVNAWLSPGTLSSPVNIAVNGVVTGQSYLYSQVSGQLVGQPFVSADVPPGQSYVITSSGNALNVAELR